MLERQSQFVIHKHRESPPENVLKRQSSFDIFYPLLVCLQFVIFARDSLAERPLSLGKSFVTVHGVQLIYLFSNKISALHVVESLDCRVHSM